MKKKKRLESIEKRVERKAGNLGTWEGKRRAEDRFVIKTKNNFTLGNEKEEKSREYREKSREKS
jgi:hypothetical protein